MINLLVQQFERLERDIKVLSSVLLIFIALLAARAVVVIYEGNFDDLWAAIAPMTALIAALLVSRVASRLITNNNIVREDDRRRDLVRVTHHLLAVANDLRSRVGYVKALLSGGNRPVFAFAAIASSIERRYETLLEREAYQYLPGRTVDLIIGMSGAVFGICTMAGALEKATADKPFSLIDSILPQDRKQQVASLDALMEDLKKVIDQIHEVRASIDPQSS